MSKLTQHTLIFLTGVILAALLSFGLILALRLVITPVKELPQVIVERERLTVPPSDVAVQEVRIRLGSAVLPIFKRKADGYYATDRPIGAALGLTSDGYIMSVGNLLRDAVILLPDGSLSTPTDLVSDEATGLVFGKLAVTGLSVARFGDSAFVERGEPTFVVGPATLTVTTLNGSILLGEVALSPAMALRRRLLTSSGAMPVGSVLSDRSGAVIGIFSDSAKSQAIPSSHLRSLVRRFLKTHQLIHPVFGAEVIDLYHDIPATGLLPDSRRGALVKSVKRGSAVERAGLKVGDVILSVERENLGAARSLSEILEQFDPGSEVEVALRRGASDLSVMIVLE